MPYTCMERTLKMDVMDMKSIESNAFYMRRDFRNRVVPLALLPPTVLLLMLFHFSFIFLHVPHRGINVIYNIIYGICKAAGMTTIDGRITMDGMSYFGKILPIVFFFFFFFLGGVLYFMTLKRHPFFYRTIHSKTY